MRRRSMKARGLSLLIVVPLLASCAHKSVYEPEADREGIRKVVQSHLRELGRCYEDALDKEPLVEGKLVLEWDLTAEGRVDRARVREATPKILPVIPCALEKLQTWQFPKPMSNEVVTVTYPFYFSENGRYMKEAADAQPSFSKPNSTSAD